MDELRAMSAPVVMSGTHDQIVQRALQLPQEALILPRGKQHVEVQEAPLQDAVIQVIGRCLALVSLAVLRKVQNLPGIRIQLIVEQVTKIL